MDSSSDDETTFSHRKTSAKKIFDSDDETDEVAANNFTEATEDFKLHLSDDDGGDDEDKESVSCKLGKDADNKIATIPEKEDSFDEAPSTNKITISPPSSPQLSAGQVTKSVPSPPGTTLAEDIRKKLNALADSDSESDIDGDLQPVLKSTGKSKKGKANRLDSDSDSDTDSNIRENRSEKKEKGSALKFKKSKSGPERKSKTNAKNAMLEIKAESQRQLRQSNIGLPYHVPKQRSLLDFLNRRKSSCSMPIKGPTEQLVEVWKQIEEREKEVEEFYKSESEHESENEESNQDAEVGASDSESSTVRVGAEPMPCEDHLNPKNTVNSVESSDESRSEPVSCALQNTETNSEVQQESSTESNSDMVAIGEKPVCDVLTNDNLIEPLPQGAASSIDVTNADSKIIIEASDSNTDIAKTSSTEVVKEYSNTQPKVLVPCQTQDSQDISLKLSETQSFLDEQKNKTEDVRNAARDISKAIDSSIGEGVVKNSKTWDELNSEMKLLDDENSDSEDVLPKEDTYKKVPVLGSGPRLSLKGAPDELIDLDDIGSIQPKTPGVQSLIERFMKHSGSKKKNNRAQTVELSLISSEKDSGGDVLEVKHESIKIVLTGDDHSRSDPTPGARLKLLKSELNRQMRKQKEEEWHKKQEEMRNNDIYEGEKDHCGSLPDEDEDEEEEEMTDSEAESEPEINDVREPKKKKRAKGLFVDEEAEVDDDNTCKGSSDDEDDNNDDEQSNKENESDDNDDNDNEQDNKLQENSDGEGDDLHLSLSVQDTQSDGTPEDKEILSEKPRSLRRILTSASDLFASQSSEWPGPLDDDDYIPAAQPNRLTCGESVKQKDDERTMQFSPMTLSLPRTQSFLDADQERTPPRLSWPSESKSQSSIKKLFTEPEPSSTQEKLDELAQLFGAKFNDSEGVSHLANTSCTQESETDLMALCSGKFVTQLPPPNDLEEETGKVLNSQFLSQDSDIETSQVVKTATEDSVDFSLKWDGDMKTVEEDDVPKEKFRLEIMSSDEEHEAVSVTDKKKKKNRKLEFSDDEDDSTQNIAPDPELSDDNQDSDEDVDDDNKAKNEKLFGIFSKEPKEVFYDSDENEIDPGAFLEKEAELSEEEDWNGSDDEDEKGLDQLEMNEADKEDIDQDLVREQLVKNHMQKMLDEDRRDVRILQEMLLEDGELHSENGGRERQFRWRNVDSTGMGDDGHKSDDENADHDEDEDDAEWRKQRHEREMFLKEQREKQKKEAGELEENDEDLENSELLQLGKSVLFKCRSTSMDSSTIKEPQATKFSVKNDLLSPDGKRNSLLSKRGSFLSRGDGILAKLAKITGPAKENVLAGAKSSGNFVFSAISPPKKDIKSEDGESKPGKRKAPSGFANPTDKKPCLVPAARKRSGLFDHL